MRLLSMYLFIILSISGLLTVVVLATGWEIELVTTLYNPTDAFSWWLRKFGKYPAILVSVLALTVILIPYLRNKSDILRRVAITWLIALFFGAGLVGGWVTVEGFDRPRPRETVLLDGSAQYTPPFIVSEEKSGKSFTSGHAAMGFLFAAPFFALRRRFPKTSYGFLTSGLLFGSVLGYTRMVLGAHFITDVIWSAACVLSLAAIGNHFWKDTSIIKSRYILIFLAVIAALIIYFNKFERVITIQHTNVKSINLDFMCDEFLLNSNENFSIALTITGYGAPVKNIDIKINDGIANISKKGLFRNLRCTRAVVKVPPEKSVAISRDQVISMGINPPFLTKQTKGQRFFSGENVKND